MQRCICTIILIISALGALTACEPNQDEIISSEPFALYINIGGEDYRDQFGHMYWGDRYSNGGRFGEMTHVKGTQDDFIYRSYREGNFSTDIPLESGLYDVTLLWAEPPSDTQRRFDVLIEGQTFYSDMSVREQRHNKSVTALSRTIPNIRIEDGFLNIGLRSRTSDAFLNGIIVRKHGEHRQQAWRQLWGDEFNYDGLPTPSLWDISTSKNNNEPLVNVEFGELVLSAERQSTQGAMTTAQIYSKERQLRRYGRIEIGARLPRAEGLRSVVWLLPDYLMQDYFQCIENKDTAHCELSQNTGEIDILERVSSEKNSVHAAVHFKNHYWNNEQQSIAGIELSSLGTKTYEYAIEWTPDRIDIYADDVLYFSYFREHESQQIPWLFDHNYHMIISQIAINDRPADTTSALHTFGIDYIRGYERIGN